MQAVRRAGRIRVSSARASAARGGNPIFENRGKIRHDIFLSGLSAEVGPRLRKL